MSLFLSYAGKELLVPLTSSVSFLCCTMTAIHSFIFSHCVWSAWIYVVNLWEFCAFVLDHRLSQMYVPGSLNDVENVLVDIGTGYYVEKATKFLLQSLYIIKNQLSLQSILSKWFVFFLSIECGRLKVFLQTQNRLPHKADRTNSASPSGKARYETR